MIGYTSDMLHQIHDFFDMRNIKANFYDFLLKSFKMLHNNVALETNWHIKLLTDALQDCVNRKIKRLIISMPPRHLKSFTTSVALPAWILSNHPHNKIISCSYSQRLSSKHASDCRKIMSSVWFKKYFPNSIIASGENTNNRFTTISNGYRFATSTGGTITGEGGDFLIIDDPHNPTHNNNKSSNNADHTVIDWFKNVLMSRLDNPTNGVVILVMHRVDEYDLVGYLLKHQPDVWHHIKLQLVSDHQHNIQLGKKIYAVREPGHILHETRINQDEVNKILQNVGHRTFMTQYQQEPSAFSDSHHLIRHIKRYENISVTFDMVCMSIDCAINFNENSDFTAIAILGYHDKQTYLIDMQRIKLSYGNLRQRIIEQITHHNPDIILIENMAHGSALIQELQQSGQYNIIPIKPNRSKVARFTKFALALENGRFSIPTNSAFNDAFLLELSAFPRGKNDDQIDALTQYFEWVNDHKYNFQNKNNQIRFI